MNVRNLRFQGGTGIQQIYKTPFLSRTQAEDAEILCTKYEAKYSAACD